MGFTVLRRKLTKTVLRRKLTKQKEQQTFLVIFICYVIANFLLIYTLEDEILISSKQWITNSTGLGQAAVPTLLEKPTAKKKLNATLSDDHSPKVNVKTVPIPKTDGYQLASYTTALCGKLYNYSAPKIVQKRIGNRTVLYRRATRTSAYLPVYWNRDQSVSLCAIWKIGTTFWKRIFMINREKRYQSLKSPYQIPFDVDYKQRKTIPRQTKNPVFRFMFTRDPYSRLLSGFVDKILAPNPVYWILLGAKAIRSVRKNPSKLSLKCGHDVTFLEFIKHVILSFKGRRAVDGHVETMIKACKPCEVKYNFIGKMETFLSDSIEMLKRLNMSIVERTLHVNGSEQAADDAIQDTVYQPFFFNLKYNGCITFEEALNRAWRKLQVRGLIGYKPFPFTEGKVGNVTHSEFLDVARTARRMSSKTERKQIQRHAFIEFYRTIPKKDLEEIRRIYNEDFKYFKYDDSPPLVFDTNITEPYYGFADTTMS